MTFARPAVVGSLLAALLLSACTADDESDPSAGASTTAAATVESPPALEAAWTADGVSRAAGLTLRPGPPDAETLVLSDDRDRVVGLDAATGAVRWTWRPPSGQICDTSAEVGDAGVLGLLLDTRKGRGDCVEVAALDVRTGELAWKRTVPGRPPYWSGTGVAVGDRTVLAEMFCDEVVRFDARSGRPLRTLAPRDRACAMDAALGHGVVAVLNDPVTADTPDDLGTGWIPPHDRVVARELYDADTARLRWRVEMPEDGASVEGVVADDPAVLVWSERGQRVAQVFDDRGRPGAVVGLRLASPNGTVVGVGQHDGVLVLQHGERSFGEDPPLVATTTHAYDLATGEERWQLPATAGAPAGMLDDRVVLTNVVQVPADDGSRAEVWLTDQEVGADGAALRTLGSVPATAGDPAVVGLVGDRLLVADGDRVHAVAVPDDGEDRVYDAPVPAYLPQADAYAEGELRSQEVDGACRAVGDDTLTALGFRTLDLPAPVDCRWSEDYHPDYLSRSLSVSAQAFAAGYGPDGEEQTGTQAALAYAEDLVERRREDAEESSYRRSTGWAVDAAVEGVLGDRVWSATTNDLGADETEVVVLWRNVVLEARVRQEVRVDDRRPAGAPLSALPLGAHDALADVLAELGAETTPAQAEPTPYVAVPDVCAVLSPVVRDLVTGAARDDSPRLTEPAPEAHCAWNDGDVEASVRLLASDPLDGDPATETAGQLFDLTAGGRRVADLGDRARLRSDFRDEYPSAYLRVLAGNALVDVSFFDQDALSEQQTVALATRMARRLLRELA